MNVQPIRARVTNGRLTLSVPTELPENTEVELQVLDPDGLSPAQRAALENELHEAAAEYRRGSQRYSSDEILRDLKSLK